MRFLAMRYGKLEDALLCQLTASMLQWSRQKTKFVTEVMR